MQWAQRQWGTLTTDARFETPEAKFDNHPYALQAYGHLVHFGNAVLARAPAGAEIPVNDIHAGTGLETLLNQAVKQWL